MLICQGSGWGHFGPCTKPRSSIGDCAKFNSHCLGFSLHPLLHVAVGTAALCSHRSNLGACMYCRLVVAEGREDVTIKVSDEGGGIRRSGLPRIWTYLYSTAKSPVDVINIEDDGPAVLAGYGYGLPISRLYARYFGGDLQLISMDGCAVLTYIGADSVSSSLQLLFCREVRCLRCVFRTCTMLLPRCSMLGALLRLQCCIAATSLG